MPTRSPPRTRGDGCGFVVGTGLFTIVLLIANGVVVTALYHAVFPDGPPKSLERVKGVQVILFLGPVLLLFVQWTLIDFGLRRMLLGRKSPGKDDKPA